MAIPTDNVDPELLERPARWDMRFIRRFMILFGPISSIFDFATFAIMIYVFHASQQLFRSGWFVESLATQSLVIFAIRTRRIPFFRSQASRALTITTLACVLVGMALPYLPVAPLLGFQALPSAFFALLLLMVVVYLGLVEIGKRLFYGAALHIPRRVTNPERQRRLLRALSFFRRYGRWKVPQEPH
jgi:Mg2+-importing ATPase